MNFRSIRPIGLTVLPVAALIGLGVGAVSAAAVERAIEREVVVPATLDQAWAAWTTREGVTSFFSPDAEIDARVGGAFHIFMDPTAAPGEKGADDMRYMALQPKKMLSFDWNAPPSLPEARAQRTFVIVRFEPVSDKETRVTLHHTGWGTGGQWDSTYAYFDKAWPRVLESLRKRFETGPQDWAPWLAQLRAYKVKEAAAAASSAASAAAK
ncbi:MAG TPA: SRPBCC domain-containing protein [Ideonella sp.]|uniref:SRPBCC family protein n=1 Tax=Ideonella sp. TaxID=1929293 RepID=UPI002E349F40|nr:SRPBCC domain-containing protein [Ideonella sp.]HEX5683928.1 SRPBCC domain-containing protein [Ideonella sp.]